MNFSEHDSDRNKKIIGITIVALIHVLVFYALLTGLGKQIIAVMKELPIQAALIEESKPPAPPAPPAPPKVVTPSKPFVPAPKVTTQQTPVPEAIQEVASTPPAPTETSAVEVTSTPAAKVSTTTQAVVDFSTCAKPDYPRNALRNEEQGTVRLQFLIGLDGRVADAKIEKSSGFRTLDTAAKNALRLCKFKPATMNGIAQQSWTTVDYVWKLPD